MSDEISVVCNLTVDNGNGSAQLLGMLRKDDQTGTDFVKGKMTASTLIKLIDQVEISDPGWLMIINHDSTYAVQLWTGLTGEAFGEVPAGHCCCIKLLTDTPAVKTTAGTAEFSYLILER